MNNIHIYERLHNNLNKLKLNRIAMIIDNYLERVQKDNVSAIEVLDYLMEEEKNYKDETSLGMRTNIAGFPFRKKEFLDIYLKLFREVFLQSSAVRRVGAAALDLALVASGIFDGFFEFFLSPWDIAAGIIIIREAGGKVKSMFGEDELSGNIIASNPYIFEDLENIVNHVINAKKLS